MPHTVNFDLTDARFKFLVCRADRSWQALGPLWAQNRRESAQGVFGLGEAAIEEIRDFMGSGTYSVAFNLTQAAFDTHVVALTNNYPLQKAAVYDKDWTTVETITTAMKADWDALKAALPAANQPSGNETNKPDL